MKSKKIKLFEELAKDFVENVEAAEVSKYNPDFLAGIGEYGAPSNNRNTCKTALRAQIVQLRKVLLDIGEEIK